MEIFIRQETSQSGEEHSDDHHCIKVHCCDDGQRRDGHHRQNLCVWNCCQDVERLALIEESVEKRRIKLPTVIAVKLRSER
jgi:hypothetical protein